MRVFVTGGTGFIGGEVVRQLCERGDDVACLVRDPAKGRKVAALGCELIAGDLGDAAAIRRGMEGCDAAIHAAAMYEVGIPASQRPAMRAANVAGTERVLRAALEAKVPRGGRMPLIPFPELGVCLTHVEDIAAGILLALDRGRVGEAYVLSGPVTTVREAIEVVARLSGRRAPRHALPTPLMRALTPVGPLVGRLMGQPPNLREIVSSGDGVTFWASHEKASRELGYAPRGMEEGLRQTLEADDRFPAPVA